MEQKKFASIKTIELEIINKYFDHYSSCIYCKSCTTLEIQSDVFIGSPCHIPLLFDKEHLLHNIMLKLLNWIEINNN